MESDAKRPEDGATPTATTPTPAEVVSKPAQQTDTAMKNPQSDDEEGDEKDIQDQPMEECVDIETLQKPLILLKDLRSLFCSSSILTGCEDMEIEDSEAVKSKDELENDLGITITASWAKAVEKSLEALFWRLYVEAYAPQIEKHTVYVADSKKAGGVKEKVLLVDAPNGLDLMLCGPVSQVQGAQSKHVVSLGGLDFWLNPPSVPPQSDICVPAWLAKGTSKSDQVTVKPQTLMMDLFLKETGEVFASSPQDEVRREAVAKYLRDDNKRTYRLNVEQENELKRLRIESFEKSEKFHELTQEITRLQQELSEQKERQRQHYEAKALKAKAKLRPEVKTQEVEVEAVEAKTQAEPAEPKDSEDSNENESKEPKENEAKVNVQEHPEQESGTGGVGEIVMQAENDTVTTGVVETSVGQSALTVTVPPGPTQLEDTAADNESNDNAKKGDQSSGLGDEADGRTGGNGTPTSLELPLPEPVGMPPHLEHPDSLKAAEETEETGKVEELNHIPASDKVKFVKISVKCHSFLGFLLSGCLLWHGEEGIFRDIRV